MNEEKLFNAIGGADEDLLERSEKKEKRVKVNWIKWGSLAACLILISGVAFYFINKNANNADTQTGAGVSGIIINGVTFYKSGWKIAVEECPAGFEYGGIVDSVNEDGKYLLNSKYYKNAEFPEWIYAYCNVWDSTPNGEVKSMAYVRFVTAESRFNYFISYNGQLYESMWSYSDEGFVFQDLYGIRIDTIPEGCVLVGSAHVEEVDRIPQTDLGVNHIQYNQSDVYANPNDSQVLYVSISLYIAFGKEKEETLHNGYDVFVRYNPDKGE